MSALPTSETSERKELPLPTDLKALALVGIFGLLSFHALYLTGDIFVPVIIAFLLKMVLQPAVETLVSLHLPRLLAALLVVAVLLAGLSGLAAVLAAPAAAWLSKAPESLARVEKRLAGVAQIAHSLQRASQDVEKMSEDATAPPSIATKGPPLSTFLFSGTRALTAGFLTIVVLLFFLLVSGSSFLRRIVEILPTLKNKKQAVDITYEIQRTVSVYLGTVTVMNAAVGILTGVAVSLCGLSDPILWGSLVFLLNFVPILGPLVGIAVLALAGLLTFDPVWQALLPAAIYLSIHIVEGEVVTPTLLARQLTLNPVVVIVALVFWYWMWGVAGALLAVPMLATFKIVCDRVESLAAIGHFLGMEAREMQAAPP
jgi:predicted PurR-regulated permease PerM